ncbi:MAG: response regulator transcription factor [Actinomycetaceae bacterium]|nr:response regulator transcription factor [Arcanobacterium sp.]MDD7687101.1 response regulator transcription factor [Actinomycetaceae bacterium]MDY5273234.1 response regulator transcription factor [Arcanobacterium sp.]
MKIFLADDAALIRAGLTEILQRAGHEIVGHASSATELETQLTAMLTAGEIVDVLITDVRMPPTMSDDGLRAAVTLRHAFPMLGVMVLSQYVAPAYASALFTPDDSPRAGCSAAAIGYGNEAGKMGARGRPWTAASTSFTGSTPTGGLGYLLKDRVMHVADFIRALTIVAAGGVVVDPEVAAGLVQAKSTVLSALTPREREVLELMAQGYSNSEIAGQLYLSVAAIAKHVANIFLKLGLAPGEENRRVRAVLAYLTATGGATAS